MPPIAQLGEAAVRRSLSEMGKLSTRIYQTSQIVLILEAFSLERNAELALPYRAILLAPTAVQTITDCGFDNVVL